MDAVNNWKQPKVHAFIKTRLSYPLKLSYFLFTQLYDGHLEGYLKGRLSTAITSKITAKTLVKVCKVFSYALFLTSAYYALTSTLVSLVALLALKETDQYFNKKYVEVIAPFNTENPLVKTTSDVVKNHLLKLLPPVALINLSRTSKHLHDVVSKTGRCLVASLITQAESLVDQNTRDFDKGMAFVSIAKAHIANKDRKSAREALHKAKALALSIQPDDHFKNMLLDFVATAYAKNRDYDEAFRTANLIQSGINKGAHLRIDLACFENEDYDQTHIEACITLKSYENHIIAQIAEFQIDRKNFDGAMATLSKLTAQNNPAVDEILRRIAKKFAENKRFDDAMGVIARIQPGLTKDQAVMEIAQLLINDGQLDAVEVIERQMRLIADTLSAVEKAKALAHIVSLQIAKEDVARAKVTLVEAIHLVQSLPPSSQQRAEALIYVAKVKGVDRTKSLELLQLANSTLRHIPPTQEIIGLFISVAEAYGAVGDLENFKATIFYVKGLPYLRDFYGKIAVLEAKMKEHKAAQETFSQMPIAPSYMPGDNRKTQYLKEMIIVYLEANDLSHVMEIVNLFESVKDSQWKKSDLYAVIRAITAKKEIATALLIVDRFIKEKSQILAQMAEHIAQKG